MGSASNFRVFGVIARHVAGATASSGVEIGLESWGDEVGGLDMGVGVIFDDVTGTTTAMGSNAVC